MAGRNIVGHCYRGGGTTNKVYMVGIRYETSENNWVVVAKWCRRGNSFQNQIKGTYQTEQAAKVCMWKLWKEKKKEGYVDITTTEYENIMRINGQSPLFMTSAEIVKGLEEDDNVPTGVMVDPIAIPAKKNQLFDEDSLQANGDEEDFVVVCVDNGGMTDKFDLGVEYVAEDSTSHNMIFVYDKYGVKSEYFKERFVTPAKWKRMKK